MIKLVITASAGGPITVQDPNPSSSIFLPQAVITVAPGATKEVDIPWQQLERLRPQLSNLEARGHCTFTVGGTDGPAYAEQSDNMGNPSFTFINLTGPISLAPRNLYVAGDDLSAGGVPATKSIFGDTSAGTIDFRAAVPGNAGNFIDIEVVDTNSGGLTIAVALVSGRTIFTINLGGSTTETCATIITAINADNAGNPTYGLLRAELSGVSTTPVTLPKDLVALTGGLGTGMAVTLAGRSCIVLDVVAPYILIRTADLTFLSPNVTILLQLWSNGKLTEISTLTG